MKCIFCVFFIQLVFYNFANAETVGLSVELDDKSERWLLGTRHEIICRGTSKNQKIYWEDPSGKVIDRWQSNNSVYVQERLSNRTTETVHVLVFTHVSLVDTGVWVCRDGNLKVHAEVCVIDDTQFSNTKTLVEVDAGGAITISCEARGNPEPRLKWYRSGQIITDADLNVTSKYKLTMKYNVNSYEGLLTILNLEPEDTGLYTCQAVQQFPQYPFCILKKMLHINLFVNCKPIMEYDSNEITLIYGSENETVEILCSANGFPRPSYKWYLHYPLVDKEIPDNNITETLDVGSIITIKADQSTFFNFYKCVASNSYGADFNIFKLIPGVKPENPKVEIINVTDAKIYLALEFQNIDETIFGIEIMYVGVPLQKPFTDSDWIYAKTVKAETVRSHDSFTTTATVNLIDIEPETKYWIRARTLRHSTGPSEWSQPISATTSSAPETETMDAEESLLPYYYSDIIFIIVCLAAIAGIVLLTIVILKRK